MGLLKRIHDNLKTAANAPINPLIADGGAQIFSKLIAKATANSLDRATEDYVFEGKKQGYAEASDEYEKKLLEQADLFLQQEKDFLKEREEYEALIDAYDKKINELQNITEKTQLEKDLLQQLLLKERELINIARG